MFHQKIVYMSPVKGKNIYCDNFVCVTEILVHQIMEHLWPSD